MRWPDLPDADKVVFTNVLSRWVGNLDNGLSLKQAGLVDEAAVDFIGGALLTCLLTSGGRRWWEEQALLAPPAVREHIEALSRSPGPENVPFDVAFPYWAALADEPRGGD